MRLAKLSDFSNTLNLHILKSLMTITAEDISI